MNARRLCRAVAPVLSLLLLCTAPVSKSLGQKKKEPPPPTGAPTINAPFPAGVTRGGSIELALTGTNLASPTQLLVGFPAKTQFVADDKADGKTVKVKLEVPADAPVGYFPMRLATAGGLSNLRLFCVDDLPQVVEGADNHDKSKAQSVPTPCVVAGKTIAEAGSFFKFSATAGQRLSFEVLGRRLGGPIDPQLTLYDGKTLRELAFDNDAPGCQGDPRFEYRFKTAGEYVLEVRDVLSRGGPDYVFRLRIGDFPMATVPIPMAARSGSKVQVSFAGPAVEGVKSVDVAVPDAPPGSVVMVTPKGASGLSGWPVPLVVSDVEEIVEKEPNQDASQATRVPVPGGVTGRFLPGDDLDVYRVTAKKGQKLAIEVQTLEWGSPTLVFLVIKDAKGKELAKNNPAAPPPGDQRIELTAADDGDLLIEVAHLLYQSGPIEAYHLSVRPVMPTFDVVLSADKLEAAQGGIAALPFVVNRKGFTGPIEVFVRGDAKTSVKLKAGQTGGLLQMPIPANAKLGGKTLILDAKADVDGKPTIVAANTKAVVSKALADLVFPPLSLQSQVNYAVKEPAPFKLSAKLDPPDAAPGTTPTVIVTLTRSPDFAEEVALNPPAGLPATIPAPKFGPIAKGKDELKFTLDVNAKVLVGDYFVLLTGKAKVQGRDVISDPAVLPLPVGAPFDLAIEPAKLDLAPGAKAKLKITATRKAGYKGPIAVELKNLPAKVTGGKATLAADKTTAEIDVTAAADTPAVERVEIEAVGTATGLNNLQGSSSAVALRVSKK
jgi:hypothetical protein